MATGRIVGARSFEALEGALASDLARLGPGPSRLVWVLVPTNLLALHLSRAVAASLGGVMGVRFLTLHAAAGELALRALAERGGRPLPEGARELVFERSLEELDEGSCFAGFAEFPGSVTTIARAIGLLESCLWSPESLQRAAGRLARRDAEAAGRLRELAGQWRGFEQFKREGRFWLTSWFRMDPIRNTLHNDRVRALSGRRGRTPKHRYAQPLPCSPPRWCRAPLWTPAQETPSTGRAEFCTTGPDVGVRRSFRAAQQHRNGC